MSPIIIMPVDAPPPPDWLGYVSYATSGAAQDLMIHYVSIVNDGTFGNILYTEPATYAITDSGNVFPYDMSYDWVNDRLVAAYTAHSSFGGPVYIDTYQRLGGAQIFQSTTNWPGVGANRPNGVTLDVAATTHYNGYSGMFSWTYPYPNGDIAGNAALVASFSPGTNIISMDIDKTDGLYMWTFEGSQNARRFLISTGVEALSFGAGGHSGAASISHGWDGMIYTGFDATAGGGLAMHADDGSSGGTPINSKANVLSAFPGRNHAGTFAWNPAVAKPF